MADGRIERENTRGRMPLPEIGKIKVGMKKQNGTKEYPTSVDYFIAQGKYADFFDKAYGQKPQTIQIYFLDDRPEVSCDERYEYRNDEGKKVAYGDGRNFYVWNPNKQTYELFSTQAHPDLMQRITRANPKKSLRPDWDGWDVVLTLRFVIAPIRGVIGYWSFTTKAAASTIPQIVETFDLLKRMNGKAKEVLCDLSVGFAKSDKPGVKSRYPVVTLVPNQSEENFEKVKGGFVPKTLLIGPDLHSDVEDVESIEAEVVI